MEKLYVNEFSKKKFEIEFLDKIFQFQPATNLSWGRRVNTRYLAHLAVLWWFCTHTIQEQPYSTFEFSSRVNLSVLAVCTVPMDRTSRCSKVYAVRLYASYKLNLLLLKSRGAWIRPANKHQICERKQR